MPFCLNAKGVQKSQIIGHLIAKGFIVKKILKKNYAILKKKKRDWFKK